MTRRILALAAFAFCLFAYDSANASFIVSGSTSGLARADASLVNFDSMALGNGGGSSNGLSLSFSNSTGGVVSGNASGYYAEPWETAAQSAQFNPSNPMSAAGGDTSQYVATGIGSAIMSFVIPERYFGILWGSVDTYNTLSFYNASGGLISSVTSAQFLPNANGDQSSPGTYYVQVSTDQAFTTVIASSTSYAFEFDDVAFSASQVAGGASTVSEASTMLIMLAALVGFGYIRRGQSPRMPA